MIRTRISRQDMAKMVGASREMVSRVMKDLERRGFIETLRKRVATCIKENACWLCGEGTGCGFRPWGKLGHLFFP
jgi:predicted transcriptional regulator